MISKWLHIEELGGDPWILPIWTAANSAREAGAVPDLPSHLSELGIHVSTRLNILPRIIRRLNTESAALYEAVKNYEQKNVYTEQAEGVSLRVDNDLKYQLIADIDAFLFETDACWRQMRQLFRSVRHYAGHPVSDANITSDLRSILKERNVTQDWFPMLDRHRNFFAHQGTPYLAIDLKEDETFELLIMKSNLRKFEAPTEFFLYVELREIANGFASVKMALRDYLVELLTQIATK